MTIDSNPIFFRTPRENRTNSMPKILYTQSEVYHEITKLFKAPSVRRVAIAAFVGKGSESYLPNPKGITLVCWPKAGATNPIALRTLMKKGVDVQFADRLHMKLYWAEGRGCVITSANLSTNALGSGNLREIGVRLKPTELNIDRVLESLSPREATKTEMARLDRAHALFVARNKMRAGASQNSFAQWLKMPNRCQWKLGWVDTYGKLSKSSQQCVADEFEVRSEQNWMVASKNEFTEGDWILNFMLDGDISTEITWLFCHRIYQVPPKDNAYVKEHPCEVIQVYPLESYPGCPFRLDSKFKKAFKSALKKYGGDRIRGANNSKPKTILIDLIAEELGI
jgi:hypothetical protein